MDPTCTRQEPMKPILFCYMKSGCHYHPIGIDYLYDAIFKMAASEVKLRFRLLLRI